MDASKDATNRVRQEILGPYNLIMNAMKEQFLAFPPPECEEATGGGPVFNHYIQDLEMALVRIILII